MNVIKVPLGGFTHVQVGLTNVPGLPTESLPNDLAFFIWQ